MTNTMRHSGIPWIGDIPNHWEVMQHKRIMHKEIEIQEHYDGENILSLTMRGVIVRDLEAGGKMPTTFDGYQKVYANDLLQCLFDIDVTPRCVGLVRQDGLVSPAYSRFVMDANAYAPYYDYLLRFMDDNKVLLHLSKNIRSSLTETDYGTIYTCVPPLTEQKAIADYLDKHCAEVDEMVSLQEKIIEELRAYRQAIITETVTHGLNPNAPMKDSRVEWIGQIPEGWVIERLKNDSVFINGYAFNSDSFTINDGVKVIRIGDISSSIDYDNCAKSVETNDSLDVYLIKENDILIAMSGATTGKSCLAKNVQKAYINQRVGIIRSKLYYFVSYVLQASYIFEYINLNNAGSAQPNISGQAIGNIPIPVPPLTEQQAIADYLYKKTAEIDQLIAIKQRKIEELKEYKKSLIYEYVTGKKEVDG